MKSEACFLSQPFGELFVLITVQDRCSVTSPVHLSPEKGAVSDRRLPVAVNDGGFERDSDCLSYDLDQQQLEEVNQNVGGWLDAAQQTSRISSTICSH